MFVLADTARFWWPVTARVPSLDEAGKIDEQRFEVLFEALPKDEADALADRMIAAARESTTAATAEEIEQIVRIVRGWRDVVDADKAAVAFSEEAVRSGCRWLWFREAVVRAYGEAMRGETRLGN